MKFTQTESNRSFAAQRRGESPACPYCGASLGVPGLRENLPRSAEPALGTPWQVFELLGGDYRGSVMASERTTSIRRVVNAGP